MDKVQQILKDNNFRNTKLRHAVLSLLLRSGQSLSHQELSKQIRISFDRVSLFRTLTSFEEAGIIHKIMDLNGIANYAYSQKNKTESLECQTHFICLNCDMIICLDETFHVERIKVPNGFQKSQI